MIGPRWLEQLQLRAKQDDYVRKEILWALHDWPGHIVPVLVNTDGPSNDQLPPALQGLFRFDYKTLQTGSITQGVDDLIDDLKELRDTVGPVRRYEKIAERSFVPAQPVDPNHLDTVPAPTDGHYRAVVDLILEGRIVPVLGCRADGVPPECEQLASWPCGHVSGPRSHLKAAI